MEESVALQLLAPNDQEYGPIISTCHEAAQWLSCCKVETTTDGKNLPERNIPSGGVFVDKNSLAICDLFQVRLN